MVFRYLASRRFEMIMVALILLLFYLIFLLFALPLEGYIVGLSIILFSYIVFLCMRYFSFKEAINDKEEIARLHAQLVDLKNMQRDYQQEVESYFLMWVHQMKTPITATKLLLESPDDETVSKVRHEILQIDNYTNLALSYLKLMNDNTDMVFMPVKIDDMIRPLLKKYSIQFIHYKTKLHYESITESVITDAQWASILIEQLLNNALKYARGKEIWITYEDDKFTIRDNGIGINPADLPKIFDRGYSGYNGRLNDKSSGIGLFIVRNIARKLSVNVDVASTPEVETTFTVTFPKR